MASEPIPSKKEWGEIPSKEELEEFTAYSDFFGKSDEEMNQKYARIVIEYAHSLRYVPTKPFQYYMKGFCDFITSGQFHESDGADVASNFLDLVEYMIMNKKECIVPIMDYLYDTTKELAINQKKYDADVDIYGDFQETLHKIEIEWKSNS